MIDPNTKLNAPVLYKTALPSGETWVSGIFLRYVTPGRTHLKASLIVTPTDTRALDAHHKQGAVLARDVYWVPADFMIGEVNRTEALTPLLESPDHAFREEHIGQILDCLDSFPEYYIVPADT